MKVCASSDIEPICPSCCLRTIARWSPSSNRKRCEDTKSVDAFRNETRIFLGDLWLGILALRTAGSWRAILYTRLQLVVHRRRLSTTASCCIHPTASAKIAVTVGDFGICVFALSRCLGIAAWRYGYGSRRRCCPRYGWCVGGSCRCSVAT